MSVMQSSVGTALLALGLRLMTAVRAAGGWRGRAIQLAAGVASVLAMAPFHVAPVLFATLPVLVWSLDGAVERSRDRDHTAGPMRGEPRRVLAIVLHPMAWVAFAPGWWFGFGYHSAGLFWVGEAFLVEAETFGWLLPFAVMLLPAGLALFWGAATALAASAWAGGPARVVVLASALTIAEWLRGHVLTGFPWNTLGHALLWPDTLLQSAAVLGIHGSTAVVVLLGAGAAIVCLEGLPSRPLVRATLLAALALPLPLLWLHGTLRLATAPATPADAPKLRIVQPSVPQREKWRPENQQRIFSQHLRLSLSGPDGKRDDLAGVRLVVWPEAAMPFVPLANPAALTAIGNMLPAGTHLAAGALRVEGPDERGSRRVYNSLLVLGAGGLPQAVYDKTHLVPFGEYLPLQPWLEAIGLQQLSRLRGGFAVGSEPRPLLQIPGLPPMAPLICYEAIFPGTVVQGAETAAGPRPGVLLNVTNDGWFGNTTGPRQHLHQARVRAVEEGLPMLRAANNGISAVIDAHGRIVTRLGMNAVGTIDAGLPSAIAPPIYARYGDGVLLAVLALLAALAGVLGRDEARRRGRSR